MRLAGQRGNHRPIGYVVHCIGDIPQQIHQDKQSDEGPARYPYREDEHKHCRIRQRAYKYPRLEFAEFRAGVLDNAAHDRIVYRIPYTTDNHNNAYCAELLGCELPGVEYVGQQERIIEIIGKVTSDSRHGIAPFVVSEQLLFRGQSFLTFDTHKVTALLFLHED